jgi:hypothetical protein
MGHANINTTDPVYTHLFNGSVDMDRLDVAAQRSPELFPVLAIGR